VYCSRSGCFFCPPICLGPALLSLLVCCCPCGCLCCLFLLLCFRLFPFSASGFWFPPVSSFCLSQGERCAHGRQRKKETSTPGGDTRFAVIPGFPVVSRIGGINLREMRQCGSTYMVFQEICPPKIS